MLLKLMVIECILESTFYIVKRGEGFVKMANFAFSFTLFSLKHFLGFH